MYIPTYAGLAALLRRSLAMTGGDWPCKGIGWHCSQKRKNQKCGTRQPQGTLKQKKTLPKSHGQRNRVSGKISPETKMAAQDAPQHVAQQKQFSQKRYLTTWKKKDYTEVHSLKISCNGTRNPQCRKNIREEKNSDKYLKKNKNKN